MSHKPSSEVLEEVIHRLRESGLSKAQSMLYLVKNHGVALGEAKSLVHLSAAWTDRKTADDQFHRDLEEALENDSDDRDCSRDALS